MRAFRSLLFVPGDRPDRFAKALQSSAEVVCADLEDAVAQNAKAEARRSVLELLEEGDTERLAIRINGVVTLAGLADIASLADASRLPRAIMLPKVEHARDLEIVAQLLDRRVDGHCAPALIALVETPRGIADAANIARSPHCSALMFGGADLAAALGVEMHWEPLFAARSAITLAAAAAGVPAIDVPHVNLNDADGLATEAARARSLGFCAKAAIHPSQLDAIHAAFRPSESSVSEARAAIAAFDAAGGSAIQFGGRLLEAPIIARFRRMLDLAGA
ncbi:CoA ester lyase [Sphingomonas gilva]|uniref:CoA ester lyase n=1 Tax=Sphingomonas gilva TaxID=2305907 RepID=A0A396RKN8_9SPHN|nr:CoA ester lyase [Sphingomonas gilva]RHW16848.1 CoA ester lyase [Sphingomonas gilva]